MWVGGGGVSSDDIIEEVDYSQTVPVEICESESGNEQAVRHLSSSNFQSLHEVFL
jgi:hypothetical protein